jgi:sugar transferase (PEP-CTERM/EpsH1 system associated)
VKQSVDQFAEKAAMKAPIASTDNHGNGGRLVIGHTIYAFKDGGMERGVLNLINYGNWDRFSHVVMCLTEAGAFASQIKSPNCSVIEFHKREGNDLQLPRRIAQKAREHEVHILHARGWPTLVETALAARIAGIRRTVYGFHGKTIEDLQGWTLKRRLLQRWLIRSYDEVVTLNSIMLTDLAKNLGLRESRIRVIANGVDVEAFRPLDRRALLRAEFGIPQDRFAIGNVARLDPVKNHETILRALGHLCDQGECPYLVLVGEGPHRAALEHEITQRGLKAHVRLFGYSENIPELLNCMDLYVQSSLYEGFSNTIIEAMACGLPVIATDVGGTADLFNDGQQGWLFTREDDETLAALVLRLKQDSELRKSMGRKARQRVVERFSVRSVVHEYEDLYLEMAAASKNHERAGIFATL